jgi:hypothetical protein
VPRTAQFDSPTGPRRRRPCSLKERGVEGKGRGSRTARGARRSTGS